MQKNISFSEKYLLGALLTFLSVILVAVVGFIFKVSLSPFTLPVSLLLLLVVSFFIDKKLCLATALNIFTLLLFCFISTIFFDWSFDGMYYHKQAVITLKEGWNPLYTSVIEADVFASYPDMELWLDHYPKGLWIFSASIYSLTNLLESAKAVNILFINAVFATSYTLMKKGFSFSGKKSLLFAFIFSINPVFLSQFFTFYNDLAVGSLVIIALCLCIMLYKGIDANTTYIALFLISAISLLIKFTAPCILAIIFLVFGILCAISHKQDLKWLIKPCSVIISGFLVGLLFFGFDPYVEHIKNGQHIIHPVMGEEKYDIMNTNPPESFSENLGFKNVFVSIFSKTSNDIGSEPTLKIPFTVSYEELEPLSNADTRIGGFGVFFSGIFMLSILLAIITRISGKKMTTELLVTISLLTLLMLFFPESWWARYASFIYYLPIFLFVYSAKKEKSKFYLVCLLIVLINSGITSYSVISEGIFKTNDINMRLEEIKSQNKKVLLRVNEFPTHVKLFSEYGIDFEVSHEPISPGESIFYRNTKYKFIE